MNIIDKKNITSAQLNGWIPYNIKFTDSEPIVDWIFADKLRFTDPFFEDTISKCRSIPQNRTGRISTTFEMLSKLKKEYSSCLPAGFIFHTSRCGSTLVSQILAALSKNIVISEAPPIDTVLRAKLMENVSDKHRTGWLVDLLYVLGQQRSKEEKSLFVKFDSWHVLDFKFISSAFPGVPSIFLYRDPIDVFASHENIRGSFMVPGIIEPEWFGWNSKWAKSASLNEYGIAVLQKIYEVGLKLVSTENLVPVNYKQLPDFIWTNLKDFFHLECTEENLNKMKETSKYYSKNPSNIFADLLQPVKHASSKHSEQLIEKYITPIYNKLEVIRKFNLYN